MTEILPESARGWLQTLLAIVERGGPVTLLLSILSSAFMVWHLTGEMRDLRSEKAEVYQQLLTEHKAHVELARTCAGEGSR